MSASSSIILALSSSLIAPTMSSNGSSYWLEIIRCVATLLSAACATFSIYLTIKLKNKDHAFTSKLNYEQRYSKGVIDYAVDELEEFQHNFSKIIIEGNGRISAKNISKTKLQVLIRAELISMQGLFYRFKTSINYRIKVYKDPNKSYDSAKTWEKCDDYLSTEIFSIENMQFCESKAKPFYNELEIVILSLNQYSKDSA